MRPVRRIVLTTLVLSAASFAQPFYAPLGTFNESIVCLDQNGHGIPYAWIELTPATYLFTNAHLHDDPTHPISTVSPLYGYANAQGAFAYTMRTTLIGQHEALLSRCIAPGGGVLHTTFQHRVGYPDLFYNHHESIWRKIGGTDTGKNTGHGTTDYNRYMRLDAAYGIYYSTLDYLGAHPNQTRVCTNDMALPWGGKFDIEALEGNPWRNPHVSHDRGTAADVAGPTSSQCPVAEQLNVAQFVQACVARGAQWNVAHANHAHCNWANPATYPH